MGMLSGLKPRTTSKLACPLAKLFARSSGMDRPSCSVLLELDMLNTVSAPPMLACDDAMIEGWP